jgi:hypothetical protein
MPAQHRSRLCVFIAEVTNSRWKTDRMIASSDMNATPGEKRKVYHGCFGF